MISLPLSTIAVEIKHLLSNIKSNTLSQNDARQIGTFFVNLTPQLVTNLVLGFAGIYVDPLTTSQVRQNVHYLMPLLWDRVSEETRQGLGIRYGKYVANNDKDRATLARQFLDIVGAAAYIPDDLKAAEIESALQNLLSAHRAFNNFYSEPPFASQLVRLVGQAGNVPRQVRNSFVLGLVEVFLTNGHGPAFSAEPHYIGMINSFSQEEALVSILSFLKERIASRLQFKLCQDKYKQLLDLVSGKITAPAARELIDAIRGFSGPLERMKDDSHMKQKVNAMKAMILA